MTHISGKHVLLTGGSRGIGPVIAETLARKGAHIALAARSEEGLRNVAESLSKFDVQTMIVAVDFAQSGQRRELVSTVLDQFGAIDILINNAGLETEGAYLSLPWEKIHETIEVNLVAPMELTYLVLPHMLDKKTGHIRQYGFDCCQMRGSLRSHVRCHQSGTGRMGTRATLGTRG